jgi:hypothetical protein
LLPLLEHRASVKRFVPLQFLNLRQSVGLLGRVIRPSQGLYLYIGQHKQNKRTHTQTSMPQVGFEPTIPASERAKTVHALDRSATVTGDHALCCMLNRGNTLVQLLHSLSLSSCQPESTIPPAAQLLLSQSQQGDLVGNHLRLSNVLERISLPSCEPLYAANTSHCKQEIFIYEYHLHWVLLLTEKAQENAALEWYTPQALSPFWLLKPPSEHAHPHLLPRLVLLWKKL